MTLYFDELFAALYLNSVVFFVTYINKTQGICGDSPRIAKLSVNCALTAKTPYKMTGSVENLDTMIVAVSDNVLANFVDSHTGQAIEFSLAVSITAKAESVLSMFIEYLDTVV